MKWPFKCSFAAVLVLLLALLPAPDRDRLLEIQGADLVEERLTPVLAAFPAPPGGEVRLSLAELDLTGTGAEGVKERLAGRLRHWAQEASTPEFTLRISAEEPHLRLRGELAGGRRSFTARIEVAGAPESAPWTGEVPFHTWIALVPPFLAILLAVVLGRTILGLLAGAFTGAWILACPGFTAGLGAVADAPGPGAWPGRVGSLLGEMVRALPAGVDLFGREILWEHCLGDQFRLAILLFVVFLCAAVGVMSRMGALQGLARALRRMATTGRRTQLATALLGLVIFFDDYANTIVVGNTMRLLTDRFRIAREKLAYLVDSTSAPVAGLSLFSTWIAFEVSTFAPQLPEVGIAESEGYAIFVRTLPYRFYCLFTLAFVFLTVLTGREFGPMLTACRRAARTGQLVRPGGRPLSGVTQPAATSPAPAFQAVIPIGLLLAVTVVCIYALGIESVYAICWGSLLAFLAAALMALAGHRLGPAGVLAGAWAGVRTLLFALVILLLAWSIGEVCARLGTAPFLVASFHQVIRPHLLPLILFLAGGLVSFSTGSSWSTMAILLPNIVILAHTLGEGLPIGPTGLMIISIGAVLEGSIFGDHCSPISDTTILSSVAAGSDHLDHTRTQIFYALVTMAAALFCGYLPVSYLGPQWAWICLPAGVAGLWLFLRLVGRRV